MASWPERVGASLVDQFAPSIAVWILIAVGASISNTLGGMMAVFGAIGTFAFFIWNLVRQGNTGQTVGKQLLKIRLLREADGAPVGPGLSIGRAFLHVVDALPCYVGFLWPLWDQKRQTFADKILTTVVVKG